MGPVWLAKVGGWVIGHPAFIGLVAVSAFAGWQTLQLSGARNALVLEQARHEVCQGNIRLQNQYIATLKAEGDRKQAEAQKAWDAAVTATRHHQERATDILRVPVPTPDKECAATLDLLKEFQK